MAVEYYGDCDGNGGVDPTDLLAVKMLRSNMNITCYNTTGSVMNATERMDVFYDGKINNLDVEIIRQMILEEVPLIEITEPINCSELVNCSGIINCSVCAACSCPSCDCPTCKRKTIYYDTYETVEVENSTCPECVNIMGFECPEVEPIIEKEIVELEKRSWWIIIFLICMIPVAAILAWWMRGWEYL